MRQLVAAFLRGDLSLRNTPSAAGIDHHVYARLKRRRVAALQGGDKSPRSKAAIRPGGPQYGRAGFTLTELLVATGIFVIIMTAVVSLFVSSIRAARSGNLAMEVYEETRMALGAVERDLTTAFTARDYGDYYQFYGTPIGMVFVGLVRSYDSFEAQPNFARVTYVLNQQYNQWYERGSFESDTGATVNTYVLLRFIEPNADNLDSFPVDWQNLRTDPEHPTIDNEFSAIENLVTVGWSQGVVDELIRAKKRQFWVRMLSESEPGVLPNPWNYLGKDKDGKYTVLFPGFLDRWPEDYIVAENITAPAPPGIDSDDRAYSSETFFRYGLVIAGDILWVPFWNADYTIPGHQPILGEQDSWFPLFRYPTAEEWAKLPVEVQTAWAPLLTDPVVAEAPLRQEVGSPFRPRLPEMVMVNVTWRYPKPHPGAPDFVRRIEEFVDVPSGYMRTAP